MPTYQFLSPEWVAAVRELRAKQTDVVVPVQSLKVNMVVTEVPFEPGIIHGYIDTSSGELLIEPGGLANADLTVTIAYSMAQRIFVERDEAAAMEAFMSGAMQVDGDLAALFALQAQTIGSGATQLAEEVLAITRDP